VDCDGIERLEIVNNSEKPVLLFDTEPAGLIGSIEWLINACSDFLLEKVNNVVENASGDRDILVNPGSVGNCEDLDW
jgi:hypothetical protein